MKLDPNGLTVANLLLDMSEKIMKVDEEDGDKLFNVALELVWNSINMEEDKDSNGPEIIKAL